MMMDKLKNNKTVLITGGASGIGAASVRRFYQSGMNIVFIDKDETMAQTLLSEFDDSDRVKFFPCDISQSKCLKEVINKAVDKFGGIDILFANAGYHFNATVLETSDEEWNDIISINLGGVFRAVKYTLPYIIKKGGGSIVLMGSDQSFVGKKSSFAYGVTKGAIGQMTKSLALDYADKNIRVNCVCPATIDTPLSQKALKGWAKREFDGDLGKAYHLEAKEHPLGRIGNAEEVAEAVYFLASEKASFITGTLLPVDGGYTAQ